MLKEGRLTEGCDGSLNGQVGRYAYYLHADCEKNSLKGWQKMESKNEKMSSLHVESLGALGCAYALEDISDSITQHD